MWNAIDWAKAFKKASSRGDKESLHALRRDVWLSTVEVARARTYNVGTERIDLDLDGSYQKMQSGTVFHPGTEGLTVQDQLRGRHRTVVSVHDADCLEIARAIAAPGKVPAVLNMASRRNPGGGVAEGSGAQEESLFRRSTAFASLYQFVDYGGDYDVPRHPTVSYPIPRESGGIFSPGILVFRSGGTTGYAFLRHPYRVNLLTVPAISKPVLVERDGRLWLTDEIARASQVKIRAILRIAAHQGQTELVLSAFGCGAFRNPPQHMAELIRAVLVEPEFAGVFGHIAFAIIDDHNAAHAASPEGNYLPFERVLAGV